MTRRVVVIDDDPGVTAVLRRGLTCDGYRVDTADSGTQGLAMIGEESPDLVILDLMLPGLDGMAVLERLRSADADLPILLLTALDRPVDQVRGLERGADDYMVKPFKFEVLAARVKALLRRREDRPKVLRFADLRLDPGIRAAARDGRDIELTSTEYEVLRQFLLHRRRVVSKDYLMDRIWGYDFEGSSNVLEVYVKQLRRKLEAAGEARLIHTIRGAGYILREP